MKKLVILLVILLGFTGCSGCFNGKDPFVDYVPWWADTNVAESVERE